jgi:hypothetical protein
LLFWAHKRRIISLLVSGAEGYFLVLISRHFLTKKMLLLMQEDRDPVVRLLVLVPLTSSDMDVTSARRLRAPQ